MAVFIRPNKGQTLDFGLVAKSMSSLLLTPFPSPVLLGFITVLTLCSLVVDVPNVPPWLTIGFVNLFCGFGALKLANRIELSLSIFSHDNIGLLPGGVSRPTLAYKLWPLHYARALAAISLILASINFILGILSDYCHQQGVIACLTVGTMEVLVALKTSMVLVIVTVVIASFWCWAHRQSNLLRRWKLQGWIVL